ncbi:MAG: DinB family protein [Chloroflexota bacterium]
MDESAALAAKLRTEGEKLSRLMAGLAESEWTAEVYAEGTTWTVRNILAHLMTSERAFLRLFDQIRRGGVGVSEDFVIDRYNASQQQKTRDMDRQELLEHYEAARAQMAELVTSLSAEDLERRARHPYLGVTTLREMVKMIYIHNQTHYRDVRRSLRSE